MFSDDDDVIKAALLSCQAQRALQRNWYPDPIGGLFSYQVFNIVYFPINFEEVLEAIWKINSFC